MNAKRGKQIVGALPILFGAVLCAGTTVRAGTYQVIQSFGLGNERGGSNLYAGLVRDSAGNLYGAAEAGGAYGYGTVYRLSPNGSGGWTQTVLYNFRGGPEDGASPHASLVLDGAGNLYGTTVQGGLEAATCNGGCGVAFQLSPASGTWQEAVLHRFPGGTGGAVPYSGLTIDSAGNLYGGVSSGGTTDNGAIYQLQPANGQWTYHLLYSFGDHPDGADPFGGLTVDGAGNVYGTTYFGGAANTGTAFELIPAGSGRWTERTLHNFRGGAGDGANPGARMIFDGEGNLYGTTQAGGPANSGVAFALSPTPSGLWSEKILHGFLGVDAQDAAIPNGLVFGNDGTIYGSSMGGGTDNPGTIFELIPVTGRGWQEKVLYNCTNSLDGFYPSSALVIDPAGHLYGTTLWGGPGGDTTGGIAFEFTP